MLFTSSECDKLLLEVNVKKTFLHASSYVVLPFLRNKYVTKLVLDF